MRVALLIAALSTVGCGGDGGPAPVLEAATLTLDDADPRSICACGEITGQDGDGNVTWLDVVFLDADGNDIVVNPTGADHRAMTEVQLYFDPIDASGMTRFTSTPVDICGVPLPGTERVTFNARVSLHDQDQQDSASLEIPIAYTACTSL